MVASGHGVNSRPVSTSLRPSTVCIKKGRETNASICAQNEHIEVQIESENSGMRNRSTGSNGTSSASWRRIKKKPTTISATSSAPISFSDCPCAKPLSAVINKPNVKAFITALGRSKRGLVPRDALAGKKRIASNRATIPSGTLIRNSHFQEAIERIAAAMVGPAAEETATIKELIPIPRPS